MRAVMLRGNALTIRCESKFEEDWLENIINALELDNIINDIEKGENKGFSVFTGTDEHTGLGFMTITPVELEETKSKDEEVR